MHSPNPEIVQCRRWIAQFDTGDQSLACSLLKGIKIVTSQDFEEWLRHIYASLVAVDGPFAAYAVRPLEPGGRIFDGRSDVVGRAVQRIGSEGRIAHVIKRWHEARGPVRVFDHPSLATMANARVRTILLLDDQIGSGARIVKYLQAFLSTPTIRSWISGGFTKIRILALTSLPKGREKIAAYTNNLPKSQRRALSISSDFEAPCLISRAATEDQELVRRLFRKYEPKLPRAERQWTFGHRKTFGTVVFEHGCSNNVPALFWSHRNLGWHGLFPNRSVPEALLRPSTSNDHLMPARPELLPHAPDHAQAVLLQVHKGKRSIAKISEHLGTRMCRIKRCLDYLRHVGAIDDQMRPTQKGVSIVSALQESDSPKYVAVLLPTDVYLPSR